MFIPNLMKKRKMITILLQRLNLCYAKRFDKIYDLISLWSRETIVHFNSLSQITDNIACLNLKMEHLNYSIRVFYNGSIWRSNFKSFQKLKIYLLDMSFQVALMHKRFVTEFAGEHRPHLFVDFGMERQIRALNELLATLGAHKF